MEEGKGKGVDDSRRQRAMGWSFVRATTIMEEKGRGRKEREKKKGEGGKERDVLPRLAEPTISSSRASQSEKRKKKGGGERGKRGRKRKGRKASDLFLPLRHYSRLCGGLYF